MFVTDHIHISANTYRRLFEESRDGVYFTTIDGEVIEVNKAFLDITGYNKDDFQAIKSSDLYVDLKQRERFRKRIETEGFVRDFEVKLYTKDREIIHCMLTSNVFYSETREPVGYMGILKDISVQKGIESALRESEKRFRELFHGSPDPIFVETLDGIILDVNPAACELHGMLYTELVGRDIFSLMPPELVDTGKANFQKFVSGSLKMVESYTYSHEEKKLIPVEINVNKIKYFGQPALLLHIRDITKRKIAERNLLEERRKRLFDITQIQEKEKKRIAKDLHDGVGQMLFGVKMQVDELKRKTKNDQVLAKEIDKSLRKVIAEVRSMAFQLRPSVLDDFGLSSALKLLFDQLMKSNHQLTIDFKVEGMDERVNPNTEIAIYRIVQEAVSNSLKHGEAEKIFVYLQKNKQHTELIVRDNGKGFDTQETNQAKFGNGLINMKERAEMLNGTFDISSVGNRGTLIKVIIPNNELEKNE